jgi:hypothetical protein
MAGLLLPLGSLPHRCAIRPDKSPVRLSRYAFLLPHFLSTISFLFFLFAPSSCRYRDLFSKILPPKIDAFRKRVLGIKFSQHNRNIAAFAQQVTMAIHPHSPNVAVVVREKKDDVGKQALYFYKIEPVSAGQAASSEVSQKVELDKDFWSEIDQEAEHIAAMSVADFPAIFSSRFDLCSGRAWRPSGPGSLLVSVGSRMVLFQGLLSKKVHRQLYSSHVLRSACALSWHPAGELAPTAPISSTLCRR